MGIELNVLISLAGILGAGFSAYVGVKVAEAEIRGNLRRVEKTLDDLEGRVDRLERPYFERGGR